MSGVVVDASVLIKLFITEEGSRRTVSAVKRAERLLAPDLAGSGKCPLEVRPAW